MVLAQKRGLQRAKVRNQSWTGKWLNVSSEPKHGVGGMIDGFMVYPYACF